MFNLFKKKKPDTDYSKEKAFLKEYDEKMKPIRELRGEPIHKTDSTQQHQAGKSISSQQN